MRIVLALLVLVACSGKGKDGDNAGRAEARLQLTKVGKNLKAYWIAMTRFPTGKTGPLPADDCCKSADHTCAVTNAWQNDKIWNDLDFMVMEPGHFRYSYESDGTAATVTAVGDPDCDGTSTTYTLRASAKEDTPIYVTDAD